MATPWYASREMVKRALDSAETARNNPRIDRALESATTSINRLLRRPHGLYPTVATKSWPWPNQQYARPWRLWLEENTLITATTVTSGGIVIPATDYFLEPVNSGPPFDCLELDLSSTAGFSTDGTPQRAIDIAGVYGHTNVETPAGALAEALDTTETGVDVTDAAAIGVGDLIRVDSERMVVTGKTMLDTTQNLQTSMAADMAVTTVAVSTGTGFAVDEIILIDSERMLVVDIAGNNLTVKRAWDGSVLAAHTAPTADIYAPRTLTVERAALGTTAATHSSSAAINRWVPPTLTPQLAIAEAIVDLETQSSGYAGKRGSGDSERDPAGGTIDDLRHRVCRAYRRKLLIGAV